MIDNSWVDCCFFSSTAVEIGFTLPRIYHVEQFRQFETFINKSGVSKQTFSLQIEVNTPLSGVGQRATLDEDFQISTQRGVTVVSRQMTSTETSIDFAYRIIGDSIPEKQESFQLSVTPAVNSPSFSCSITKGCYQHVEVVIQDDDGE